MIGYLIADLLSTFLGTVTVEGLEGRKRLKEARRGLYSGALRVASGSQNGLSSEWLIGQWHVRPGSLSLGAVTVPIVETFTGSRRPAHAHEFPGAREIIIITIRSATAELEWALLRRSERHALRALSVPESDATHA